MIDAIVIKEGTPIFKDLKHQLNLKLINTKTFKSATLLLSY